MLQTHEQLIKLVQRHTASYADDLLPELRYLALSTHAHVFAIQTI